jgi:Nucleotidyl transferase AbiEii toxin, Type IV TA system
MATGNSGSDLSPFQLEVARLFFALPASQGFLLAGGAALLAQHLTARPTEDLDFFTAPERGHVLAARDALEAAVRQRGWSAERIHDSDTFCRMVIRSADAGMLVDLAVHAPPDLPASSTPAGPTLARRNSLVTSCSPCLTGQPHGTSPMSTSWPTASARTSYSHGPPGSTRASTPRCSPT